MGPRRLAWLGSSSLPGSQRDAPWQLDTVSGLWERSPAGKPAPYLPASSRGQIVHYVPSQRRVLLWDSSAPNPDLIWYFDCEARTWSSETRPGAPRLNGTSVSCITDSEQIYVYGVDKSDVARLWFYDPQTGSWTLTQAPGVPAARVKYTSAFAGLIHDSSANAIVMKYGASSYPSFHVYELATQSWRSQPIDPPTQLQPLFRWKSLNSFYAPHLGVHVHHVSDSGSGTGRILVHRL
jgi:hypothetical protein